MTRGKFSYAAAEWGDDDGVSAATGPALLLTLLVVFALPPPWPLPSMLLLMSLVLSTYHAQGARASAEPWVSASTSGFRLKDQLGEDG